MARGSKKNKPEVPNNDLTIYGYNTPTEEDFEELLSDKEIHPEDKFLRSLKYPDTVVKLPQN